MGEFNRNRYRFSSGSNIFEISEEIRAIRERQIFFLLKELVLYKVEIKDLINIFPSFRDRELVLNLAKYCYEDYEVYERIQKRRELPLNLISKKTKASRAFLELWHDYIMTYILILSNPNYKYIQDYICIEDRSQTEKMSLSLNTSEEEKRGLVLKENKRNVIVITRQGEFLRLKKNEEILLGTEYSGEEKKGIRHYKLQIAIAAALIAMILGVAYFRYITPVTTIVMDTTSQIKFEVNRYNKVTYVYSPTEKGQAMIGEVSPRDKNIDNAIYECLIYAGENEMIPSERILITINGEALEYGILQKTAKFSRENNKTILVNNAGNSHSLWDLINDEEEE